ncbi:hypothetical protein [Streptomyces longispororuber]|uniref:hypothetical protein n=1 Tax=Streptomyces longispororuber TaxID=68230 RepID=UPI00210ED9A7|nr:hypothetical protein [Streptomyces longispororuber]MCQ4210410.1 hypothetical protein [Streptomyces longispororuber]
MSALVIEAPPAEAPAGTKIAVYACLPSSEFRDSALRGVFGLASRSGWVPAGTFIDIAEFASPATDRLERTKALELVARGGASGIVVPVYAMLFFHPGEHAEIVAWQQETGAWVSSPWNTAVVAERLGVARLRQAGAVS